MCMPLKNPNVLHDFKQGNFAPISAPQIACAAQHTWASKESLGVFSVFRESEGAVVMRLRPCGAHETWIGTTNVSATDFQEQATMGTGLLLDHAGLCLGLSA